MADFDSRMPPPDPDVTCSGCGEKISPDVCWCGDDLEHSSWGEGHSPVPMGCCCYMNKEFGMAQAPRPTTIPD